MTANASRREELLAHFQGLALGLLWFQQHDTAVNATERQQNLRYGLCQDEFVNNKHFPTQLYIREARRLNVKTMFTERDMVATEPGGRPPLRPDSVAVGTFPIDSFPCSAKRPSTNPNTKLPSLEGYIGMNSAIISPNTLPLSMLLPPTVPNLVVAVAVGASHVAFSSVRLEPTWMLRAIPSSNLVHANF